MKITLILSLLTILGVVYAGNPCCSFPCLNRGVCMTVGFEDYKCDCEGLEFYGRHCEIPYLFKRIKLWLKPGPETVHHLLTHHKWFWDIINNIQWLQDAVMLYVYKARAEKIESPPIYTSDHEYVTADAAFNSSYFSRVLPPVPADCPTPLGVKGKKELPDVEQIVQKLFVRKKFIPDPIGSNLLLAYFAQHFTHQFFKTDREKGPGFQWGGHNVDVSHVYGKDKKSENLLRSFKDGKMKAQITDGEEYPPLLKDAPVPMTYFPNVPETQKYAVGHEFFGLLPGLLVYSTIWLREHNRVCDILKREHPEWNDEQLFQTAKLIILGETIQITIADYVQHLSNYHFKVEFKPELLFGEPFQYQNRISVEFNHLYHWHPLMADSLTVNGTEYKIKDQMFNGGLLIKHGMKDFVDALSRSQAGEVRLNNNNIYTLDVVRKTLLYGRQLRYQSYNEYRKRFGLKPYRSFEELTGDKYYSALLKDFYGDIDGLEFYVGLLAEKRAENSMFGLSIVEIGGPFSVKGLMANPICSPQFWRPSTFGGEVGFNLVKSATLEKLFCLNIKGECPLVKFQIPDFKLNDDTPSHDLIDDFYWS